MSLKFGLVGSSKVIVKPKIVVLGAGGAGCNAVNNMIALGLTDIQFIVANTDAQPLASSLCENRIQLGASLTSGLGAGSSPEIGKRAAEESIHEIEDYIKDANMLFIAAGMGGGTGTGATPVIAKLAKEMNILTVGVVTKPFYFEQQKRLEVAEAGIAELDRYCDTLIVISNQKLFGIANEDTTFAEAFKIADNVLVSGVKCITNLITSPGIVNLDFADVRSVMSSLGRAIMGEGEASGENRAIRAAEAAITNPLLEHSSIVGASSILINITSGPDITLFEVNDIMQRITKELKTGAISKFGSVIDPNMEGIIRVSIVATGIKTEAFIEEEEEEEESSYEKHKSYTQSNKQPQVKKQDYIREYPHNAKPVASTKPSFAKPILKQEAVEEVPTNNTIIFPSPNKKEEDILFEEEDVMIAEGQSFFIPPAARRSVKQGSSYQSKDGNYNTGNGLFSKIFNKKN